MHGFRNTQHESLQLGELAEDNAASDGKKGYLPRWPTVALHNRDWRRMACHADEIQEKWADLLWL